MMYDISSSNSISRAVCSSSNCLIITQPVAPPCCGFVSLRQLQSVMFMVSSILLNLSVTYNVMYDTQYK